MQAPDGLLFCDGVEPRRYTQAEINARAPFPANLRRDLAQNNLGEKHCGWSP